MEGRVRYPQLTIHTNVIERVTGQLRDTQAEVVRLRESLQTLTVERDNAQAKGDALHRELVDVHTSLADMERQRDEARRELATEGAAMADALGEVKKLVESQGVPVGEYWSDIPLAVDTMIAEADTKPRERVEPAFYSSIDVARDEVHRLQQERVTLRERLQSILRELQTKPENWELLGMVESITATLTARAEKAERELARFQRAEVGERVRHLESVDVEASNFSRRMALNERAELLSIVRQQAAEIERLKSDEAFQLGAHARTLTAMSSVTKDGQELRRQLDARQTEIDNLKKSVSFWLDERNRSEAMLLAEAKRRADAERIAGEHFAKICKLHTELDAAHARLSAIRERVDGIPTYGFTDPGRVALVVRSEVLSALETKTESGCVFRQTVDHNPRSCSNDAHYNCEAKP